MARDKKLIIGNWKMHMTIHEASLFAHKLAKLVKRHHDVEVVLAPGFLAIQSISLQIDHKQFKLAAQNIYWRDEGAFTGEVSATQLHGLVQYAIIGHSERRHIFNEPDRETRFKVQAAIRNKIRPVLCVGETHVERHDGETISALHHQIISGLANITSEELSQVVIAYEPVWAIGTGKNASVTDVEKAAKSIRNQVAHLYGKEAADQLSVLYGGSVTTENASDYLQADGIDGLLIGGTSLNAHAFSEIAKKAHRTQLQRHEKETT